jgi:hypothetical protein
MCSTDLRKLFKTNFTKTNARAEDLFHADAQKDGRTNRHNENNSQFPILCYILMKHEFYREIFKNSQHKIL